MALVTAYFASENSLTVCGLHMELLGDLNEETKLPAEPEDELTHPVPIAQITSWGVGGKQFMYFVGWNFLQQFPEEPKVYP